METLVSRNGFYSEAICTMLLQPMGLSAHLHCTYLSYFRKLKIKESQFALGCRRKSGNIWNLPVLWIQTLF